MHKKKGASLIEVMAAIAIMGMLSIVVVGMCMQSNKTEIKNSTMISETSVLETIADYMYSAPVEYYTENLGLINGNKKTTGTQNCEFVIESTNLKGLINNLNNIQVGQDNTPNINEVGNLDGKIKFIGVIKVEYIKDEVYGCEILLYTTSNGALLNMLNKTELEAGGFYNGSLSELYKKNFSTIKRNIIINTIGEKAISGNDGSSSGSWNPSKNSSGEGWIPSGWNPNSIIPKNIVSPLYWNWGTWGKMEWWNGEWDPGSWFYDNWINLGNGLYQMKNEDYKYNNSTGIVYQENNLGQYIEIGRTIPGIFNDWQRYNWTNFGFGIYRSTINSDMWYDNNNGGIYYSVWDLAKDVILNQKPVRITIPHIFSE